MKSVCESVSTRSAQIVAAATEALITYVESTSPRDSYSIAVDGSLYEKYPHFADRIYSALKMLRPGDYSKIRFVAAKDGSGVGAAIIAAAVSSKDPDHILARSFTARPVDALLKDLRSNNPAVRAAAGRELSRRDPKLFGEKLEAFYASLPVSGKRIMEAAKLTGRPVLALNIDNGEISSLQIRAQMEAALDANAYLIFEVGPGALKTYDKAKPQLPEYCARVAWDIFKETGRQVTYAVHLDHNQIDLKKYKSDPEKALQEALDRAITALEAGFTSFATDTSTLTNLDAKREDYATEEEYLEARLGDVIKTGVAVLTAIYRKAKELGIEVGHEGEVGDVGKELTTF
ncbi:MAG TPA: class II fructose-bisphosphate aldolase, partial [Candidatus Omnitrophota bacterium]|nr:class II fructose-bisphosphate aldolase [Candidatus Omnitrophota bacterium]